MAFRAWFVALKALASYRRDARDMAPHVRRVAATAGGDVGAEAAAPARERVGDTALLVRVAVAHGLP